MLKVIDRAGILKKIDDSKHKLLRQSSQLVAAEVVDWFIDFIKSYPTVEYTTKEELAIDILQEIDSALHDIALKYAEAGHKDYFAVCENIHYVVVSPIVKKYTEEEK